MGLQADRISEYIKYRDISYGELSKRTGISKSALQRYATGETTKIPIDRIELISSALNVSPAYIMGWSDFPDKPIEDEGIHLYNQLDKEDRAEIRGEMKHMLKADKYKKASSVQTVIKETLIDQINSAVKNNTHHV